MHIVTSGFAFRYKDTLSGARQIFAYLLPGDFCDMHVALLDRMDHSIGTISPCTIANIPRRMLLELIEHPRISHAFRMCALVDAATLREWLLNVGRRPAEQRIAHLFCEIHARLKAVDQVIDGEAFSLPISQLVLVDTVGLSDVHVNRSLRALREAGLVTFRNHVVSIPDIGKLEEYADFDQSYLHLKADAKKGPASRS